MNDEQAKKLREAFPTNAVGKLPRITCKACSEARDKVCGNHRKSKCGECGNFITNAHLHLDYVGHAATTDRLLSVDPAWTWRFLAANPDGSPVVFNSGLADPFAKVGLWIELSACGVPTPGFGEGKNFKEAIGDAIRNAAMRRGVALDLWAKEDLHAAGDEPAAPQDTQPTNPPSTPESKAEGLTTVLLTILKDTNPDAVAATEQRIKERRGGEPLTDHIKWLERCIATAKENAKTAKERAESPFQAPKKAA